jgi:hypothetical protein
MYSRGQISRKSMGMVKLVYLFDNKWLMVWLQVRYRASQNYAHIVLDFKEKKNSIELSPPIQFRIEWADSQGMSPLLGCRPI